MHKVEMADLLLAIVQKSPIGIVILDHKGKVIVCNENAASTLNIPINANQLTGLFLEDAIPGSSNMKHWIAQPYGANDTLYIDTAKKIMRSVFMSGYIMMIETFPDAVHANTDNIPTVTKTQSTLENIDTLTGIPNRLYFAQLSEKRLIDLPASSSTRLIIIDLKGLDQVNAALGHDAGDELLRYASLQLKTFCESQDNLYARIGGDKFCILNTHVTAMEWPFKQYTAQLQQALSHPTTIAGFTISAACSIGIAIDTTREKTISELLKLANIACHRSKIVGYPVIFEESLRSLSHQQLKLTNDLKNALKNNEFTLYLQPSLDLNLDKITACEALLRWDHPELGILLPHDFIPILEQSELVHEALFHFLEIVMSHICTLGKTIQVAVNFSPKNLCAPNLINKITTLMRRYAISPNLLCVELTETAMMTADDSAQKTLAQLRSLGVKISLDDYGTGYSTLSRIMSLPIDQIKIDRSFVSNMRFSPKDKMIISSTIELAKNLDLEVVLEGVEYKQQIDMLRSLGADIIQGYYLSTPQPIEKIKAFIEQYNGESS